jgi:AcrR family transcriptional regulator
MPKLIDVDRLFDATLAVFAQHGYSGTTAWEIAERAGVNEVTIFRRYGTKAALVNAAFEHHLGATPFAALDAGWT